MKKKKLEKKLKLSKKTLFLVENLPRTNPSESWTQRLGQSSK
jgi:hypothetical protein